MAYLTHKKHTYTQYILKHTYHICLNSIHTIHNHSFWKTQLLPASFLFYTFCYITYNMFLSAVRMKQYFKLGQIKNYIPTVLLTTRNIILLPISLKLRKFYILEVIQNGKIQTFPDKYAHISIQLPSLMSALFQNI